MHVTVRHGVGGAEARRRVDAIVDRLIARDWGGAVTVGRPERSWDGECLRFSFELARGFLAMTIAGHLEVGDESATIDVAIPGLVESFVGSERIRAVLERELSAALK